MSESPVGRTPPSTFTAPAPLTPHLAAPPPPHAAAPALPGLRLNAAGAPLRQEPASLGLLPPVAGQAPLGGTESDALALRRRIARPCPAALVGAGSFQRVVQVHWSGRPWYGIFQPLGALAQCQAAGCVRSQPPGPGQLCWLHAMRDGIVNGGFLGAGALPGNHAAEDRLLLAVLAALAFAGIPGVEVSMNRGAGRVDIVFRRHVGGVWIYVFVDVKSNDLWTPASYNQFVAPSAVEAASMPGTRVYVVRANFHSYTTANGTFVAEAMQAGPDSQIRGANRALWTALNLVVPMLAGSTAFMRVRGATLVHPDVDVTEYLAFYSERFPLLDVAMPIAAVGAADLVAIQLVDPNFQPMVPLPGQPLARLSDLVTGGPGTFTAMLFTYLDAGLCLWVSISPRPPNLLLPYHSTPHATRPALAAPAASMHCRGTRRRPLVERPRRPWRRLLRSIQPAG